MWRGHRADTRAETRWVTRGAGAYPVRSWSILIPPLDLAAALDKLNSFWLLGTQQVCTVHVPNTKPSSVLRCGFNHQQMLHGLHRFHFFQVLSQKDIWMGPNYYKFKVLVPRNCKMRHSLGYVLIITVLGYLFSNNLFLTLQSFIS